MPRHRPSLRFEEPYDAIFNGLLSFRRLADAEATLKRLEQLRQFYVRADDKRGVECCRLVALTGRRRAEQIGRNARVDPALRKQKQEIASWFRVWLENPGLFEDWLELRQRTTEYSELRNEE